MSKEDEECYSEEGYDYYDETDDYEVSDNFTIDANGNFINEDNQVVDEYGSYIDEREVYVNEYCSYVDENGYKVSSDGRYIDLDGRVLPGLVPAHTVYQTKKSRARRVYGEEDEIEILPFCLAFIMFLIYTLVTIFG